MCLILLYLPLCLCFAYIAHAEQGNDDDVGFGYWIGLQDRVEEGTYEWVDGKPVRS